jgi:hypothetical protein
MMMRYASSASQNMKPNSAFQSQFSQYIYTALHTQVACAKEQQESSPDARVLWLQAPPHARSLPSDGNSTQHHQQGATVVLAHRPRGRVPFVFFGEFDGVLEIGSGSYKTVSRAVWRHAQLEGRQGDDRGVSDRDWSAGDGGHVAVAICVPRKEDGISREAAVFERLGRHPHLTQLLALTINHQNMTSLVTEFAPLGGLDGLVNGYAERGVRVGDDVWITVSMQVCLGMQHLGRHGLIHRDLAARNVLVFEFDHLQPARVLVKITDYGEHLNWYPTRVCMS